MGEPVEIKGQPASGGIASGPLIVLGGHRQKRISSGDPKIELSDLHKALAAAAIDLAALISRVDKDGGEILAFQLAFLEDDTLKSAVEALIMGGSAADEAWRKVVDDETGGYETADDEYFRGRAADIREVRDRVLRYLDGSSEATGAPGAILIGEELGPTLFLETDWSGGGGVLLTAGSASSHVAMLARARGVPMIVGLGNINLNGHREAIIDGETGIAVLSPSRAERQRFGAKLQELNDRTIREAEFRYRQGMTGDGERIEVMINVASADEVDHIDISTCDGIGLMRTEFLFRDGAPLPDEEQQYQAYRKLLLWAGNKPVTIRTLDAGGDKPIGGITPESERNPFLGKRGIRLTLAQPKIFMSQLRALARAAVHGRLKVMIPMVTVPAEIAETARLVDMAVRELDAEGIANARPPIGIMVEVPAAAITPELFAEAAFFSIGSNDLTQYVTAAARDEASVAALNDPAHPAVLKLIAAVAEFGRKRSIPVSLCGDMASEPCYLEALLTAGIKSLSVAPSAIARVKAALTAIRIGR
jgi:phosphotransferase system enzyme I (PtsI)